MRAPTRGGGLRWDVGDGEITALPTVQSLKWSRDCLRRCTGLLARPWRSTSGARPPPFRERPGSAPCFAASRSRTTRPGTTEARHPGLSFGVPPRPVPCFLASSRSVSGISTIDRGEMLVHYAFRYGTADLDRVAECLREEWDAHHRRVVAEIPADELLVFDIESDPPEALCDFVGAPRACAPFYTRENATMNRFGRALVRTVPHAVKRRIPAAWKRPVKNRLRAR